MKRCIKPLRPTCEFRKSSTASIAMCNILGDGYFCKVEGEYMESKITERESARERGLKEVEMMDKWLVEMNEYTLVCPEAEILDRISDAMKEVRKAKLRVKMFYGIDC